MRRFCVVSPFLKTQIYNKCVKKYKIWKSFYVLLGENAFATNQLILLKRWYYWKGGQEDMLLPRQHSDTIVEIILKYYWILLSKRWPRRSTTPSSTLWCSSYQVRWSLAIDRYFVFAWNEKIQIKWLFDGHIWFWVIKMYTN